MKTLEEIIKGLKSREETKKATVLYLKENYEQVTETLKDLSAYNIEQLMQALYYDVDVLCQYSDFFIRHKEIRHVTYLEHILSQYAQDSKLINAYAEYYLDMYCKYTEQSPEFYSAIFLIDNYKQRTIDRMEKLPPKKRIDAIYALRGILPPEEYADIINKELKTAKADYKTELLHEQKVIEMLSPIDLKTPAVMPLADGDLITSEQASAIASDEKNDMISIWEEKFPGLSIEESLLFLNSLKTSDREKEVANNYPENGERHLGVTGYPKWHIFKQILKLNTGPIPLLGLALRKSNKTEINGKAVYTPRPIDFDGGNWSFLTDLRQLLPFLEQQDLLPDFNPVFYLVLSASGSNIFQQPEAVWPLFAEHYEYLDASFGLYNKHKAIYLNTKDALHVVDCFPTIPQRYIYPLIDVLFYNDDDSELAFNILRKLPNVKQLLIDALSLYSSKDQKTINFYLNELALEENQVPMRKFEHTENGSNKFWNIVQNGREYIVEYGAIGKKARTDTKEFDNMSKCQAAIAKIIAKKLSEGYVETTIEQILLEPDENNLPTDYSADAAGSFIHHILPHDLRKKYSIMEIHYIVEGIMEYVDDADRNPNNLDEMLNYVVNVFGSLSGTDKELTSDELRIINMGFEKFCQVLEDK